MNSPIVSNHAWLSRDSSESWIALAAQVLGCDVSVIHSQAGRSSFTMLGGTSLQAMEFSALAKRRSGRGVDISSVLGPRPLSEVASLACSTEQTPVAGQHTGETPELKRTCQAMLLSDQLHTESPFRLLFSADISGPLDTARLALALARITCRHPALRTVFTRDPQDGTIAARVVPSWSPTLIRWELPPYDGADLVGDLQSQLAAAAPGWLRPFDRPPAVFVLSEVHDQRAILSVIAHHAVMDGWSIGLLWRELAAEYVTVTSGEGGSVLADPATALVSPAISQYSAQRRARMLEGLPTTVQIPSDRQRPAERTLAGARLVFGLSDTARAGCTSLASELGLTRNTILLAAWALVVARRAAVPDLLIGMSSACRTTEESLHSVGPFVNLLPVACRVRDDHSVAQYLHQTGEAIREALDAGDVPFEDLVATLGLGGDESRNPLVQVAFAAHDELVPGVLQAGDLTMKIREGYCGGTSFDALLYVRRWGHAPQLALEYASGALRPDEAAGLARAVDCALTEMAAAPDGPLADVRTMSQAERHLAVSLGAGPDADASASLWPLIERNARLSPDAIAVRDADPARTLTYRELLHAAEAQSSELATAGISEGDCVALAMRPSAREIVAILAVLRLGAAYMGIDPGTPPAVMGAMLDAARAALVLGDTDLISAIQGALGARPVLQVTDPWRSASCSRQVPAAAAARPEHTAYLAFTSGSTGTPKGIRVPHRGVVRLTLNPDYLRPGASDRFMRLAPLAFDASTLEIFAPLVAGGTVEIFPDRHVAPDELAAFLRDRTITGLWLTAGLFRVVADDQPGAFTGVRQVLTGGDVVPPAQVSSVLRACPGLRITNGYGPTENTTFTTVHHIDDVAEVIDPLPIGRPIQGTGVLVLDPGGRLVPSGGIGELYAYGDGLALEYAERPAENAHSFGQLSSETSRRLYRTGDLVRWDTAGQLRFLGRADRQVKVRGFRIELDQVERVLREYPAVRDAAVVAAPSAAGDRRLLAGVVCDEDAALPGLVRSFAADRLPGYAIPSLWAFVPGLPTTQNGKLDLRRLEELAISGERRPPTAQIRPAARTEPLLDGALGPAVQDDVEPVIAAAWDQVLGKGPHGSDQRFFEVGGDSLQLIKVAAVLRRNLPGHDIAIGDLYACQTIGTLADRLRTRQVSATRAQGVR